MNHERDRSWSYSRILVWFGVALLALIFVVSAMAKMETGVAANTMYARWIDHRPWLHWSWIGLELGLAVALLRPRTRRAGLWASVLVLSFLTGLLVMELQRPVPQPCGCDGAAAVTRLADIRHGLQWALARNAGLETLAVCILLLVPVQKSFLEAKTGQK